MFKKFFIPGISGAMTPILFLSLIALLPLVSGCGNTDVASLLPLLSALDEDDTPNVDNQEQGDTPLIQSYVDDDEIYLYSDRFIFEIEGYSRDSIENGGLTLRVRQELEVEVEFLDLTDTAGRYVLSLTEYDPNIIRITDFHRDDDEDDDEDDEDDAYDDEDAEWSFEIIGIAPGTTHLKFNVTNRNDPDFTAARSIPVTVR